MDPSKEYLTHAGEYKLETLEILSQNTGEFADITAFMLEINLYEDLFSSCMTGSLILADAANLIANLPILGNELLRMKFRTPTLEDTPTNVISKTFQIYAIYDRILNDDRSQYYNISFVSLEGHEDQTTVIKKAYKGTTEEIAKDIYEEFIQLDKSLIVLDTPHVSKVKYTSNHWSPFKNMNFLTRRSKGSKLEGSDYLFYESNKSFYFASIEGLIYTQRTNGVFDEYVFERQGAGMPRRIADLNYVGNRLPDSLTAIEDIKMLTTLDTMAGNNSGAFSASGVGYDFLSKKIVNESLDYFAAMKDFVKTGPFSTIPDTLKRNPLANKTFYAHNSALHNDFGVSSEEGAPPGTDTIVSKSVNRRFYMNTFENNKVQLTLPGRTDIEVGVLINILYPSAEAPNEDESTQLDPLLSGLYIISAIHHKFNTDRHIMIAEAIKNGYSNSPNNYALQEEEVNVS